MKTALVDAREHCEMGAQSGLGVPALTIRSVRTTLVLVPMTYALRDERFFRLPQSDPNSLTSGIPEIQT
jgi:hypothetical protein